MPLTADDFLSRVTASGVLPADVVSDWLLSLPAADRPADGEQLARRLVKGQLLTAYQAQQLYAGKGKSLLVGNYVIVDKLGQGGMGLVLKAEHRLMKRVVALKVLSPAVTQSPALVARFQREAQAAARLAHPNIVAAFDADEADGTHYLVMEYVDGQDLSTVVKRHGPLSVERAVDCVRQAARGLAYAHGHGVIHRDIKPANLLRDGQGTVKILDMGLARIEGETGRQAELTNTGAVMGTVDYMAPEQALNTKSARSDIYSLGITLWYLLTGRPAYDGDSLMARMLAHRDAPLPSLAEALREGSPGTAVPGLLDALDDVFHRMIAKNPADRYQRMDEVLAALEGLQQGETPAPPPLPAPESSSVPDDSQFHAFLAGLQTGPVTVAGGGVKTVATRAAATEHEATLAVSRSEESTDPQTLLTLAQERQRGQKSVWWRDRRVQAGAVVAAVLLLLGALFLPGRKLATTETATEQITIAAGSSTDGPSPAAVEPGDYALRFRGRGYVVLEGIEFEPGRSYTVEARVREAWASMPAVIAMARQDGRWLGLYSESGGDSLGGLASIDGRQGLYRHHRSTGNESGWVHVAVCWDATVPGFEVFVDGQPVNGSFGEGLQSRWSHSALQPRSGPATWTLGAVPLTHADQPETHASFFVGELDEVRISRGVRYRGAFTVSKRHEPDADTLALYHCDEGQGDRLLDATEQARDGKIVNVDWLRVDVVEPQASPVRVPQWVSPNRSPSAATSFALTFDGVDDYVQIPGLLPPDGPFTLEAWVEPGPLAASNLLGLYGPQLHASLWGSSSSAGMTVAGSDWSVVAKSTPGLDAGREVHVAGVSADGRATFFLNGRLLATSGQRGRGEPGAPQDGGYLGGLPEVGFWRGRMSAVRVSQGARYTGDFTPDRQLAVDPDTLALYRMDEGQGSVLQDASGNNRQGRIVGASWVSLMNAPAEPDAPTRWPDDAPPLAVAPFDAVTARQHQTAWSEYLGVPVEFTDPHGTVFRLIPPGEFLMGSTADELQQLQEFAEREGEGWEAAVLESERPQHKVRISRPFYLGKFETTNREFRAFIAQQSALAWEPVGAGADDEPAGGMTQAMIDAYLVWREQQTGLKYRLPTEAEWEYACRAGTTTAFSFGEALSSEQANFNGRYPYGGADAGPDRAAPTPVGTFAANPFGLHDMHGNVWEVCADFFYGAYYFISPGHDPPGPGNGTLPVIRGGDYEESRGFAVRSATRYAYPLPYPTIGFRVVREIPQRPGGYARKPSATVGGKPALKFEGLGAVEFDRPLEYDPDSCTIEMYLTPAAEMRDARIYLLSGNAGIGTGVTLGVTWRLSHVMLPNGHFGFETQQRFEIGRRVHLAAVCSATEHCLYVDGKRAGRIERRGQEFALSKSPPKMGLRYQGTIDELRVSRVPRYAAEFTPPLRHQADADTLALYLFDEGEGVMLHDTSGNERHGWLAGPQWTRLPAAPAGVKR
jgi:eukaryotic-like serine/threonine-protein kinase